MMDWPSKRRVVPYTSCAGVSGKISVHSVESQVALLEDSNSR